MKNDEFKVAINSSFFNYHLASLNNVDGEVFDYFAENECSVIHSKYQVELMPPL